MKKIDAYIDVDGILFQYPRPVRAISDCNLFVQSKKGHMNMRPNATDFLYWCDERFNCHWLTAWRDTAPALAHYIYAHCAVNWPVCQWDKNKTEEIDFLHNWVWIDDDPSDRDYENIEMYHKPGVIGELVLADPYNEKELSRIKWRLREILKSYKGE